MSAAHHLTRDARHAPRRRFDAKRRLVRLLTRRFGTVPAETAARLGRATPEQIALWAERVLDARTLDEVFAGN